MTRIRAKASRRIAARGLATLAGATLLAPVAVAGQESTVPRQGETVRGAPAEVVVPRIERLAAGGEPETALDAVGRLWILAVEEESAVGAGLEAVGLLRSASPAPTAEEDRLLRAYEGAFLALRAKHGGWPRERLRNLREGFRILDAAVAEAPDAARVRYVRLMSGFYLPGIFGRGDEVDADLATLARLIPGALPAFPPALQPEIVRFLLDHAELDAERREQLEAHLR